MEQDQPSAGDQAEPQPWVNPTPPRRYDLVVVGDTPEAVAAVRGARGPGRRIALVQPPQPTDTTTADLQAAAYALRRAAAAIHSGAAEALPDRFPPGTGRLDFAALLQQVRQRQARVARAETPQQLAGSGIDVYCGPVRFTAPDALDVEGRGLAFRRAILAPGAAPGEADMAGARQAGCLRSETLLGLAELPGRLVVAGLGPGPCQWAQTFRRLGSQVHLIGREPAVLPEEDPRAARLVQAQLEREGVGLHLGCDELSVEKTGKSLAVLIRRGQHRKKLFAGQVLADGPRRPRIAGLGLEAAGVACADRGILVGDRLQTSNRRIFAIGEVCGPEFSSPPAAETMARLAVHNALGWTARRFNRPLVPHCVYTDPQVVRIGLTARQAAAQHLRINTYRAELSEVDRAVLDGQEEGFAEVHVRSRTGRIVGATIVAHQAAQWIGPLMLLTARDLSLAALAEVIPCYPTRLELLRRLARRCQQAQPPRFWSGPVEWLETTWRRLRQWMRRGEMRNDECRRTNVEGMTKHQ